MPFAPSSVLVASSEALVTRSDALVPTSATVFSASKPRCMGSGRSSDPKGSAGKGVTSQSQAARTYTEMTFMLYIFCFFYFFLF